MTKDEANKIIHEARGLCWHSHAKPWPMCSCGYEYYLLHTHFNLDYHTREGFWDAWEWAIKEEWWDKFLDDIIEKIYPSEGEDVFCVVALVNHITFATVLAEWWKKRGEK